MNSKRTVGVALAFALVTATGSVALAGPVVFEHGPNLVSNGGFEASSTTAGNGWTASGFASEGFDYFIDTSPANAHSGNNSFAGGYTHMSAAR